MALMRWLAVVLALVSASVADAKTLIIRAETDPALSPTAKTVLEQYQTFTKMLEARGATYQSTHISNTKTEWMRTGLQVWGTFNQASARTEQFDCVVIFNYNQSTIWPTSANAESLTFGVKWPQVPVVFMGDYGQAAGKWTASSACSTGVKSLGTAYSTVRRTYVIYPVGSTHPWKSMGLSLQPVVNIAHAVAGVTFRPVAAMNYSATTPGGVPSTARLLRADADSTGYTAVGNDSILLWVRTNNVTNVPIIFCEPSGSMVDIGLMSMAMQMADSASGGNVWDAPRAKPIQAALAVTAVASRGDYRTAQDTQPVSTSARPTHLMGGAFCHADSCDTTNVLAGLDSLATLGGLKTTFFVEPCSLATYPSVKNWLYRAGQYRVGIQGTAGFGVATTQIMGAASDTYPIDPLGATRTRFAAQSSTCSAASDTALITCNLLRGRAIIRSYFGDLFDPSIFPSGGDWSPVAYTRPGGGPGIDSVAYAIWKGGVRAVIIRPEWYPSSVGVSAYSPSAVGATLLTGAFSPALNPFGYGPDARRVPVYSDPSGSAGSLIGYLKIVAERGEHGMPNVAPSANLSHDTRSETVHGLIGDSWYFAPIIGHNHMFFTKTQVLHVSLNRLGGHGASISARNGWFDIKHTHNQFKAANALGWVDPVSGKQRAMFEWVYVSELQP